MRLIEASFQFISEKLSSLDFVLITGDNARHDNDPQTRRTLSEIQAINARAINFFMDAFPHSHKKYKTSIPIIPCIGNNDLIPHNYLEYTPSHDNHVLEFFATVWKPFIPSTQISTFKKGGYFYKKVSKHLIVASLNSMFFFNLNRAIGDCDGDSPGDAQLHWLESKVLHPALKSQAAVYISGHIPPIAMYFLPKCLAKYRALCSKYESTISAEFYGHMNIDHYLLSSATNTMDDSSKFSLPSLSSHQPLQLPFTSFPKTSTGPAWVPKYASALLHHYTKATENPSAHSYPLFITPSIVPAFNPAIRVFFYNKHGGNHNRHHHRVTSYDQYFADLAAYNADEKSSVNASGIHMYKLLYRADWDLMKHAKQLAGMDETLSEKDLERLRSDWERYMVVGYEGD